MTAAQKQMGKSVIRTKQRRMKDHRQRETIAFNITRFLLIK
jgi:hypothetical protein